MKHVLIVGTGLIGSSIGLALKEGGFGGTIDGWDGDAGELATSLRMGAIDQALASREEVPATRADVVVLATPVLAILDWMQRLAPHLADTQLVTDAGSTKLQIATLAGQQYNQAGRARFLPGHPMAGKEHGGAQHAEANLFRGATWLFTPCTAESSTLEAGWRAAIAGFGAHTRDMNPAHHDQLCAWVSHLPQMLSTALAAVLQETFAADPEGMAAVQAIGGRALQETTRLGASPYSMWRDVAMTNTEPIATTLLALEQHLTLMRENLRTPLLRDEFHSANAFRARPSR